MVRIAEIQADSIADELELEIGTRIVRINGERVRDGIDFTFLSAEPELRLEAVTPEGERRFLDVERVPGQGLGIVPEPDKIRECANECVFCFIDGNPDHVRETLWLRDDDFRLSFTYGSYVTLTNLGPRGMRRLVDQRLSPLYVSVHATEPEVRTRLLKNERAGRIMEDLRFLLDGGLEVHSQVVLCPGWNDGEHLDRTMEDLFGLGSGVRTLSVVPVGLTRYNMNRPVRPVTPAEARRALEQVDRMRDLAGRERETSWCYGADELFLLADEPVPDRDYYDDWPLMENGVGSLRSFLDDIDEFLEGLERGEEALPDLSGRRVRIVTGLSMSPFLHERKDRLAAGLGTDVEILDTRNDFFGESVTVAGLLAGRDMLREAGDSGEGDIVLLPAESLNGDDLFIDSLSLQDFRDSVSPATVLTGHEITDALRSIPRTFA
ncbi:MAG: DUF512 domain-containing protein [Gemmatimonadota bacterium]